jgi:hypothetical protein
VNEDRTLERRKVVAGLREKLAKLENELKSGFASKQKCSLLFDNAHFAVTNYKESQISLADILKLAAGHVAGVRQDLSEAIMQFSGSLLLI